MAAITIHSNLESKKKKSVTAPTFFHSICHEVMRLDAMVTGAFSFFFLLLFFFFNIEFQARFFTLLCHPHQEALWFIFTFCIRMVLCAYLKLLIFLWEILITAYDSLCLTFLTMYFA